MQNKLTTSQIQDIISQAPKDMPKVVILKGLIDKGFALEGFNEPKKESNIFQKIGASIVNSPENIANTVTDVIGAGAQTAGQYLGEKLGTRDVADHVSFADRLKREGENNSSLSNIIDPNAKVETRDITTLKGVKGLAGDIIETGINFVPGGGELKGAGMVTKVLKSGITGSKIGGAVGAAEGLKNDSDLGGILGSSLQGAATGAALGGAMSVAIPLLKGVTNYAGKIIKNPSSYSDPVKNLASELLTPTGPESTLSVLAPFKSGISLDTKVSIPTADGYVSKTLRSLTEEEQQLLKGDTLSKYQKFYEQSGKAKINAKELTAADVVGQTIDKNVEKVNQIRKDVGAQMGQIEKKSSDIVVDLSGTKSLQNFVDNVSENKLKAGYAGSNALTPETKTFLKDLNTLQKRTPIVSEVLDFTRKWNNKLENLKDKFGSYTKDKFDLGNISNVVQDLKNQARNTLGGVDETYKSLITKYRETSQLRDTANTLLGKDGLYGDSLKGSAVVKRAVKSIQDQGSRQFLKKLEDLTGYDGLSEAQVALKAMEDAGDARGLSLLELVKDIPQGNETVTGYAIKGAKKILKQGLPTEKQRTENYIKNDYSRREPNNTSIRATPKTPSKNNPAPPSSIPPAISNMGNSILQKGNIVKFFEGLTPYAKTQLIKELTKLNN